MRETCVETPCKENNKKKYNRAREWERTLERERTKERQREREREKARQSERERKRERERDINITLASIFYERVFYKIHTISVYLVAIALIV